MRKLLALSCLVIFAGAVTTGSDSTNTTAFARGGGGGGRGGGGFGGGRGFGGGDRGFGDRGFGDRGFGDRGFGDRGMGDRDFGDRGDRGDTWRDQGPLSHTSEDTLRSDANRTWNGGRDLATDGMGYGMHDNAITHNWSPAYMTNRGADIRNNFNRYDAFRNGYWDRYPGSWWYRGWGDYYPWGGIGWDDLAGYWGVPAIDTPTDYDYGDNIYYQDDNVYYGSQPVATQADYYSQAQALATAPPNVVIAKGQPTNTGPASAWKPLGVYALSQNGEPSTTMFQLAVNKDGTLRGNYYNSLTSEDKPLKGKVDKKTGRAAWMIEGNTSVIYEAGISNLLHAQCSALVHKGKDKTEQWLMVKVDQSQSQSQNKNQSQKQSS